MSERKGKDEQQLVMEAQQERCNAALSELRRCAVDLSYARAKVSLQIALFDARLKELSLGVAAWVSIAKGADWSRDLGYSKVQGKWGIALRTVKEGDGAPNSKRVEEVWLYKDSPTYMQAEAVGRLADLLEALVMRTKDWTEKLHASARRIAGLQERPGEQAPETSSALEKEPAVMKDAKLVCTLAEVPISTELFPQDYKITVTFVVRAGHCVVCAETDSTREITLIPHCASSTVRLGQG